MSKAQPQMRFLARCLLAGEAARNRTAAQTAPAIFSVFEKLRPRLTTLMGDTGFCALLARALAAAVEEVPSLGALQVNEAGDLQVPAGSDVQVTLDNRGEGSIVLLARLLTLLTALVGEDLTLRLLREIWAEELLNNTGFNAGYRK